MRYAACNEIAAHLPFAEACDLIAASGFEGIEIAPFTLSDDPSTIDGATARRIRRTIHDAGLACAGLHWLLRAPAGSHLVHPDQHIRRSSWDLLHSLIDLCGELEGEFLVLGSGKQRGHTGEETAETARAVLRDGLAGLGDRCERAGVFFLVEPLPARITNAINTLEQARRLIVQTGHPRITSMFDFHNCEDESDTWDRLIERHRDVIRHVHLNDRAGRAPSLSRLDREELDEFVAAFNALGTAGYSNWVSLEVFGEDDSAQKALSETRSFLSWITSVTECRTGHPPGQ